MKITQKQFNTLYTFLSNSKDFNQEDLLEFVEKSEVTDLEKTTTLATSSLSPAEVIEFFIKTSRDEYHRPVDIEVCDSFFVYEYSTIHGATSYIIPLEFETKQQAALFANQQNSRYSDSNS